MNTRKTGGVWEKEARQWLIDHGYRILENNFGCRFGEIDLIAFKEDTIVFFEVKYRKNGSSGSAQESVSLRKQKRICSTADYYRMKYGITEKYGFRFDVIAINGGTITHIENAFPYQGRF